MKKKGKGKPRGMNYADVLKARRDRLQLAMDEAALLNVEQSMQRYLWLMWSMSLSRSFSFLDWKLILRWPGTREFRKH